MIYYRHRLLSRTFELLLWLAAALCFGFIAWNQVLAMQADRASLRLSRQQYAGEPATLVSSQTQDQKSGAVIGRLTIQALGISVPMTAGVETASLLHGVGHINGTAFPGGLGTLALAGHRDTYFRPLENIAKKMDVEVTDASGVYHYEVESWEIVTPEQVNVLNIRDRPELVLITCYPFHYVGAAPKRFIVHARLISLAPDARSRQDGGASVHP